MASCAAAGVERTLNMPSVGGEVSSIFASLIGTSLLNLKRFWPRETPGLRERMHDLERSSTKVMAHGEILKSL